MGLLFKPKMEVSLIVCYPRVSKPSRGCQFMAGPASHEGGVRMAGPGLMDKYCRPGKNVMAASHLPSKRGSGLVFMFEWRKKCLMMLSSFSGRSFSLAFAHHVQFIPLGSDVQLTPGK